MNERYCQFCKTLVLAEMEEAKYLQQIDRDIRPKGCREFKSETKNGVD